MLPPGPRGPALATLLDYALRPESFFARARSRYGASFTARLAGLGTFVFLGDPAAIRDVFLGDPEVLRTGEANAFAVETLGPSSVLLLDGEAHARQRRALIPPLHGEHLAAHASLMRDLCDVEIDRWREGRPVPLEDACREITLQVILRVVFGVSGEARERLAALVRRATHLLSHPLAFCAPALPRWLGRVGRVGEIARLHAQIDAALLDVIASRRAADGAGNDVLSTLLRVRRPDGAPLADRELRDHLYTMLLAGHDTTAIALAWALGELLDAPEELRRVQEELRQVVGDAALTSEHARQLTSLDAAIKESLRLRPLVDFCVRRLAAPFTAGGVTYPAGVTLAPCMLLVHLRPEVFPDPLAFRPERFLRQRPDPYSWIPFGGGVRRCLGMNFALLEMRVVLATILRRVCFAPRRGARPRMQRRGLFLAPSDRATFVPVQIEERPGSARISEAGPEAWGGPGTDSRGR